VWAKAIRLKNIMARLEAIFLLPPTEFELAKELELD
jgi:hypothetical protein